VNGLRDGIGNGISYAMSATITIDIAGRLVLPKAMRDRLHLRAGSKLKADVIADKIELTPEPDESVRLVRRGKLLVITGMKKPFDAVAAIKAARVERDEQLAGRHRKR
jgi:AbrB family looped-hinge helix DNA binding protein